MTEDLRDETPVVVGVGLARESEYVLRKVAMLAGDPRRIVAVHVLESHYSLPYAEGLAAVVDEGTSADLEAAAARSLRELCESVGVERSMIAHGQPANELHEIAAAEGARVVAIGTHGRHGWRALLGQTANAVLHGTRTNVLAILTTDEPRPYTGTYDKILVAVDMSEEAESVVSTAAAIADRFDAELDLVSVITPLSEIYAGVDMRQLPYVGSFERTAEEQVTARLAQLAGIRSGSRIVVRHGDLAREIRKVAREIEADLVVLGTHGVGGAALILGSTSNAVLHDVPCDLLAVRVGMAQDPQALDSLHRRWRDLHDEQADLLQKLVDRPSGSDLWEQLEAVTEQKSDVLAEIRALDPDAQD